MKNGSIFIYVICLLGLLLGLTSCGPKEIPDDKMEAILHDVFLVNAYVATYQKNEINLDSVDVYHPIFEKYGYDIEDFRYSMDRMALKKSSRLAELIDKATSDIKAENDFFQGRDKIAQRIDSMINRYYQDTVLFRTDSVWLRDLKFKDSLILRLPTEEGHYRVSYNYLVDTSDNSGFLPMRYKTLDSKGEEVYSNSRTLSRSGGKKKMTADFAAGPDVDSLELILADYPARTTKMGLRLDSLLIVHEKPLDLTRSRYWKDQIFLYTRKKYSLPHVPYPQDSSALYIVPPLWPDTTAHTDL